MAGIASAMPPPFRAVKMAAFPQKGKYPRPAGCRIQNDATVKMRRDY
jgi:hypothetical protein